MTLEFSGEICQWRGPAPCYFVTVPQEQSLDLKAVSASVTDGWRGEPGLGKDADG